jgi:hypothetical protein
VVVSILHWIAELGAMNFLKEYFHLFVALLQNGF